MRSGRITPLDLRRLQQRSQVFGTSALELMLVITFLILLMLLAYFSLIAPNRAVDASSEGTPGAERPNSLPDKIASLERELESALAETREESAKADILREQNSNLRERNQDLQERLGGSGNAEGSIEQLSERLRESEGHQWPPIIRLDEADGYSFKTNSSEVSSGFEQLLVSKVVPRIVDIGQRYEAYTIEIVGHTDERPIYARSNLDENLLPFLRGQRSEPLAAADNAGLGFARAAAVSAILSNSRDLRAYRVTPLSGAHVILRAGTISDGSDDGDRPGRRRIEIRMRRADDTTRPDERRQPDSSPDCIDINTADVGTLTSAGINHNIAQGIVGDRVVNGPYGSPQEVTRVQGIGIEAVADLRRAGVCAQ